MPWWVETGIKGNTAILRKAGKSPGKNWILIPGSTDAMTRNQAGHQLAQDIADGLLGESVVNGIEKVPGVQNAVDAAKSAENTAKSVGDFLGQLSDRNTWIRVAKVVVGGTLLIVGLAKMAGVDKGVVGKAVRVAPLL